jgi:hypothetical protein
MAWTTFHRWPPQIVWISASSTIDHPARAERDHDRGDGRQPLVPRPGARFRSAPYAVWTGIGAVGTAILGIVLFAEPATAARLGCIGLIVAGIVGLKLVTPT